MVYKIVIFDIDGVLFEKPDIPHKEDSVAASSWDSLFQELDIYDIHERLKHIYMNKGFRTYMEWTDTACCVLKAKGLNKETFDKLMFGRPLMHNAKDTISKIKKHGMVTGAVSGSFAALANRVKEELGIDHTLAQCDLKFDNNGELNDWKLFATDYNDKVKFVRYIAQLNQATLKECVYVGDDVNDVAVFEKVGLAIAFNSYKERVVNAADVIIKEKDLSKVLPHLGL
ncbi:MAG: HAD-IB family phosphatase [Candidatus Marsarchaeota archaeon]|nr:HAD-IB family phosphatase [Candidatus Marsarchaeota archaeon]